MNEKEIMSEEAFKELINNLEIVEKLTPYGRKAIKYWVNKLQKENEKLKYKNKDLLRKLRNRVKEVKKLTKYSQYKKEFSRLNQIIKEKDNQIDLILKEQIEDGYLVNFHNLEEAREYYKKKQKRKENKWNINVKHVEDVID